LRLFILMCLFSFSAHAMNYRVFDEKEFDKLTEKDKTMVLHFYASWCPTCKKQKNVVDGFIKPIEGKVPFVLVDYDEYEAMKKKYNVKVQSTLVYLNNGKEVSRMVAETDEASIKTFIQQIYKK
jgi:thioredoxin 1